jgi:hypothetical protein
MYRPLVTGVSIVSVILGLGLLTTRQAHRLAVCKEFAEGHTRKQQLVLAIAGKLDWYVKEHRRYELPREAADAAKMAVWFRSLADYHAQMGLRYRQASWRPWAPIPTERR